MFENTIRVKARIINVLENIENKNIPSQLELKVDDLLKVEHQIQEEFGKYASKFGLIVGEKNTRQFTHPLYEFGYNHGRSLFSRIPNTENLLIGVKGSGKSDWYHKRDKLAYPIIKNFNAWYKTDIYIGGETLHFSKTQYINALLLNALIQRHNLSQAITKPLQVLHLEELPIYRNGSTKLFSIDDYWKQFRIDRNRKRMNSPRLKDQN